MTLMIIGKISGYHGLKGELKVYPLLDNIEKFSEFDSLIINAKKYKLISFRPNKTFVLIKLDGIDSRTDAENITGYIEADLVEDLSDTEIYIQDLIGLDVLNQTGVLIGSVTGYSDIGQKLLVVKLNDKFSDKKELLLPFVDEYIIEIAKDKSNIKVKLTEDILELAQ